jgi:hypothetical protein
MKKVLTYLVFFILYIIIFLINIKIISVNLIHKKCKSIVNSMIITKINIKD